MGFRFMEKEKEDNLIEIDVASWGNVDGVYDCYGKFDTTHKFTTCDFNPDNGWYRIATYTADKILKFEKNGVKVSFSSEQLEKEVRSVPEANWMYYESMSRP